MSQPRVRTDNPYSTGFIVNFGDGDYGLYRNKIKHIPSPGDIAHLVTEFDRLDILAFNTYSDSKYWWVIADVNESIFDPLSLPVGEYIIIPDINKIKAYIF